MKEVSLEAAFSFSVQKNLWAVGEMSREGRVNSLLPGKYFAMSILIIYISCHSVEGLFDQFKTRGILHAIVIY